MKKPTVLVVDDFSNMRRFAKEILEPDFLVDTASNYDDALAKLRAQVIPYDVAVLDIRLDDREELNEAGLDLLNEIHALGGYTQGIIWTGYETLRTMRKALGQLGAFDYLLKSSRDDTSKLDVRLEKAVKQAAERAAKIKGMPLVSQPRKILLIDPQVIWRERLANLLCNWHYEVVVASNYEEAISRLRQEYFRLIIIGLGVSQASDSQEMLDFLMEAKDSSTESDFVILTPFDEFANRISRAMRQYRVLGVFPKLEPFDETRFGEFISHTLSPQTQKYLAVCFVPYKIETTLAVGEKYRIEIQIINKLETQSRYLSYASFPISPAESPMSLLARFYPYDMEVLGPLEQEVKVFFDEDSESVYFEFEMLRPGKKEIVIDFFSRPQLNWIRQLSFAIDVVGVGE